MCLKVKESRKNRDKDIPTCVHVPDDRNSHSWARPKLGAFQGSQMGGRGTRI